MGLELEITSVRGNQSNKQRPIALNLSWMGHSCLFFDLFISEWHIFNIVVNENNQEREMQ